jgi:hypothetical protein
MEIQDGVLSVDGLATTEPQVVIFMAMRIHHLAAMPKRGPPTAPILMGIVIVENEPAAFHFSITKLLAAPT